MTQQITGLGSGLDTNSIIEQLVAIERRSQDRFRSRATQSQIQLANYQAVRSLMGHLRTAAQALVRGTDWLNLSATTSDSNVADVTASSGTITGSVAFTVDRLASSASSRSSNVISGTTTQIASDGSLFVAAGGTRLGLATIASDDALALGSHTIEVTQSSAAASKSGDAALSASTVIDGANRSLNIRVNGTNYALTIADGTYDRTQLAQAVQDAAGAAGAPVTVSVNANTNELEIVTQREGSAASVQVTGGTAVSALELTTDLTAIQGTDAKVTVDDGAEITLSSIEAGGTASLAAAAGNLNVTFSGGLREGTLTGKNVTTGDGSLGSVVANINGAAAGVTAAAVQVGDGQFRLQISASTTGVAGAPSIATSEFNAAVGGMVTMSAGSDSQITVGSGAGAYSITSTSNIISNLLPGVSVTLKRESATAVTIGVGRDSGAIADKVEALVDAANDVRETIAFATKYDPDTKKASALTGDSTVRRIVSDLSLALSDATSWTTPGSPGLAGVSLDREGKYVFDRSKFLTTFNENPQAMARVFTQGGAATNGAVNFVSAGDRTRAGTYDVVVTTPAAEAQSVGLTGAWPKLTPPTVHVRIGGEEVEYAIGATDTQSDVVTALNSRFLSDGLDITATISGTGIELRTKDYGTAATFDVDWGTGYETVNGVDVAGSIGGVIGTGSAQQLSIAFDDTTLGGLALQVSATAAGAVGTFTYEPGSAQRLASAVNRATDSVTGYLSTAENAKKDRIKFVNESVAHMDQRLAQFELRLRRQYASLDSILGQLKNQGGFLSGQISSSSTQNS